MRDKFFISDTHFSHEKCWSTFKNVDGTPLRPFSSTEEMDETMVENWNKVVKPNDRVYHLGDVVIKRSALSILSRLNGKKILIRGNHDIFKLKDYSEHFEDIHGVFVLPDMMLSHIPIHHESVQRFKVNVHGHLHANRVMIDGNIDPRYFSVCVEQINYTPIAYEDLQTSIINQQGNYYGSE